MSLIMSWSKCKLEMGRTGDNDAFASTLFEPGVVNDKSANLTTEDGDKLEAKATGGIVVAVEEGERKVKLTVRIKEMDFRNEAKILGIELTGEDEPSSLPITTNVVKEDFSVKLTPKNIGAIGIKIRRSHVTFAPGYSEEEGSYVDLTFEVLACADGELYTRFRVTADDLFTPAVPVISQIGNSIGITCATEGATLQYKIGTGNWNNYTAPITATSGDNNKVLSAKATKNGKTSAVATRNITYTA